MGDNQIRPPVRDKAMVTLSNSHIGQETILVLSHSKLTTYSSY